MAGAGARRLGQRRLLRLRRRREGKRPRPLRSGGRGGLRRGRGLGGAGAGRLRRVRRGALRGALGRRRARLDRLERGVQVAGGPGGAARADGGAGGRLGIRLHRLERGEAGRESGVRSVICPLQPAGFTAGLAITTAAGLLLAHHECKSMKQIHEANRAALDRAGRPAGGAMNGSSDAALQGRVPLPAAEGALRAGRARDGHQVRPLLRRLPLGDRRAARRHRCF